MKNVFHLGHHDLRLILRDRSSYIWLVALPLLMIWFGSFAARGPGGPNTPRPALQIDNRDAGFLGRVFLEELGTQGVQLQKPGESGTARRGLVIPADFTSRVLEKQRVELRYFKLEGSDDAQSMLVVFRLFRAVVALNAHLVEHVKNHRGAPPDEAGLLATIQAPNRIALATSFGGRKPSPVGFSHSVPAMMVMYVLMNLMIFGGASVANDRRRGVLRRLTAHPVRRPELIFGKLYGLLLLGIAQVILYLLAGRFAFGVNFGENVAGVFLLMLLLSWVAAGLGVLIGSLVRSEDKVVGLCLGLALPASALGGCWWPLEVVNEHLRTAALFVPTGWAMKGLHQLITFGADFGSVIPSLLVLAAFGLAANLAAVRFFRL